MSVFDIHAYLEGYPIPGVNQNTAQVLQVLQQRGIERAILLSARAARVDPLSGNRILKAMMDQGAGLFGCLTANLSRVDVSVQAIRDLLGQKRFVCVLLATPTPKEPLNPLVADEILNACRRYQKPIYINTPNAACVQVALQLARTYNMHKFILLGMGGVEWRTGIAAAQQATNIFLETSGPLDRAKIPAAAEAIGAHRILYGSGCPYLDPAAAIGLIEESELSDHSRQNILFDNAARLFNLDEIELAE
jgi:predicted TIM-barrel fold metal-dependent hydrolase